ncbi:glycosyltransferase family 9 protein [Pseudodesulfovibrio tunisiensis]|uniref:glycosyltransferase family 9 protein n=1 Tax=Pseudodesulfovibrio tunisiensis TaxID=463192 RepID=UPI001FB4F0A3|nr:glycosyltransferase family 9 protein [Pseudodesulfovibrio tunisiensis]
MKHPAPGSPLAVFRLGHMGDVVLTTGVLHRWHERFGHTFVVLTRSGNAPLLHGNPAVREVVGLDESVLHGKAWATECARLATKYRNLALVDLHGTLRSRILGLRWKAPVYRYPKFGLTRRLFNLTRWDRFRLPLEAVNVPQRYALALEASPPDRTEVLPRIFPDKAETEAAATRLAAIASDAPLIALHPYATHPTKAWPHDHWAKLTGLLDKAGMDWFVVGRNEQPLFPNAPRDLTNATNLRETCALLARANALVTNDSGPMHLASAVGTPVAVFFGPTAKAWGFQPSGPRDMVLERPLDCRPCSLHGARGCERGLECLTSITPQDALAAVNTILQE